ncbi:glycosyltransferase family 2 protein (plasmid) [Sulfitobacter pontiacus]|uniref:glycosyltransferase family 2 protein n=1 Tax=Sulfitobacter pontiacus TaxID=60137 RepID=UPI002AC8DC82|nr:glycosyltransferase family 2 protein [Sulfitobacter pontiacus]WPZ27565.1 glycosyltransferase family 2 protein [Sulfitobacter pontiacus]
MDFFLIDMPLVDIIIVNWNSGDQLRQCIDSIRLYGSSHLGKCIVIDNGSEDGSANFLKNARDVDLVLTGENLGFGRACNLGADRGNSELVLFLNPDAILLPNSLAGAINVFQKSGAENIGIVGVQLIGEDGELQRTCARFPTVTLMLAKCTGLATLIGGLNFHMQSWAHDRTRQVDHVIGAFYLIRRTLFEVLDGFDDRFFVYLEDLDLSYRASSLGYQSVFIAEAQAFHKGGGVSEQVKAHRLFYSLRSRILYAFKHFSMFSAIIVLLATLLIEPISRVIFLLLRGRLSEIADLGRGYRMLWGWVFVHDLQGGSGDSHEDS